MKIAILGPRGRFGFGDDLAREFARRGHEVYEVDADTRRRMRTKCLTLCAREVAEMRAKLMEIRPEVVLSHWTYEYARAAVTSGFPCVVVAHDSPWRVWRLMRLPRMLFRAMYATFLVLPRVRQLIVVSPHIAEDLQRLVGRKCKLTMIPNGIAANDPKDKSHSEVRENARTIVCVTEGNRLKNADVMTVAFELLKARHPDWTLKMLMKGVNEVSRAEVLRVLREEADVFCSPSLEESFGMAFLEAMSQGVPCVGGEKSGAVPWVLGCEKVKVEGVGVGVGEGVGVGVGVGEGVGVGVGEISPGGVVCEVTKPEKLAECLERVMLDYGLRKRLSEGGLRRVREDFNLEKVADNYLAVLASVIKS